MWKCPKNKKNWFDGILACRSDAIDKRFAFSDDGFSKDGFLSFYILGLSSHPAGRGHCH